MANRELVTTNIARLDSHIIVINTFLPSLRYSRSIGWEAFLRCVVWFEVAIPEALLPIACGFCELRVYDLPTANLTSLFCQLCWWPWFFVTEFLVPYFITQWNSKHIPFHRPMCNIEFTYKANNKISDPPRLYAIGHNSSLEIRTVDAIHTKYRRKCSFSSLKTKL